MRIWESSGLRRLTGTENGVFKVTSSSILPVTVRPTIPRLRTRGEPLFSVLLIGDEGDLGILLYVEAGITDTRRVVIGRHANAGTPTPQAVKDAGKGKGPALSRGAAGHTGVIFVLTV